MPVAKSTSKARRTRTTAIKSTPAKSSTTKRVNKTRSRKVAMTETPKAETLNINVPEVAKVETKTITKSLLKDYPRDGFAIFLLPLLLLEAGVKEVLQLAGTLK
tara:strand:- start:50 stop:361 length:312 start_codon:yes stop_codon:yes gene_type:complete